MLCGREMREAGGVRGAAHARLVACFFFPSLSHRHSPFSWLWRAWLCARGRVWVLAQRVCEQKSPSRVQNAERRRRKKLFPRSRNSILASARPLLAHSLFRVSAHEAALRSTLHTRSQRELTDAPRRAAHPATAPQAFSRPLPPLPALASLRQDRKKKKKKRMVDTRCANRVMTGASVGGALGASIGEWKA